MATVFLRFLIDGSWVWSTMDHGCGPRWIMGVVHHGEVCCELKKNWVASGSIACRRVARGNVGDVGLPAARSRHGNYASPYKFLSESDNFPKTGIFP